MTSNIERTAREAYEQLPARDKLLVQSWRALGNSWFDSMINSGVLTSRRRVRPEEAAREAERERIDQLIVAERERLNFVSGPEGARRESAQHEAAHLVVAESFGLNVKLAAIRSDNGGTCMYERAKTPFQTAAIALAGECWVEVFCSEFFGLATGCENDRRAAVSAVGNGFELERAWNYAWQTLKDNQNIVRAVAKRIERDGHYMP